MTLLMSPSIYCIDPLHEQLIATMFILPCLRHTTLLTVLFVHPSSLILYLSFLIPWNVLPSLYIGSNVNDGLLPNVSFQGIQGTAQTWNRAFTPTGRKHI